MSIAAALARFSTKLQHSTDAQLQQVVEWAGRNMCYVVPPFSDLTFTSHFDSILAAAPEIYLGAQLDYFSGFYMFPGGLYDRD